MSLVAQIQVLVGELDLSVDFEAAPGETIAILGPNGAGKTTLVRALAGLQPIDSGRIVLDERVLDERVLGQRSGPGKEIFVPPEQRDAGVLFQDLALFPHMSALANVAFALESGGVPKREAERRALALLGSLAIGSVAGARPASLSGGEAQRVALARALVREPRMLLLDEPLSSLDASTRSNTRATLREVLEGFDGVRIIVTHDLADVVALASRVLVLESGAITHQGSIQEVLANPSSDYVRHLVSQNPNI
ncbi:MAG: ATP-binding cassette domain-containing protein [Actinobacteria bacterium]|uniref:Unannotated protein n=1 Tax=freshwater metagenome TaxID=449393 RepID=A0A6J7QZI4_9ZZZZ|nr:ATP-binding cassette domain-containing protein [Actinomycetota bacterium]